MKEPTDLIEYRKRTIQSGKNARLYGSILYFAVWTILFITEDYNSLPMMIFMMFFGFLIMFAWINTRLYFERQKLSRLQEYYNTKDKKK
jgi:hypothetical protein